MLFSFKNIFEKKSFGLLMLLSLAAIGLILLVVGGNIAKSSGSEAVTESEDLDAYVQQLENEIKTLCNSVKGVKNATVTVTLERGFSSVYATEEGRDGDSSYVIIGNGSNARALLISKETPVIRGIGIVCLGGGDDLIRQELISLLSATYRVNTNRIYVTEAG